AAAATPSAATTTISGSTGRPGARELGTVTGTANVGSGPGGVGGGGGAQMYRSTSMSRGNRARHGSLPHPPSGGVPAAAGALLSGPYGTGSLQPWGTTSTSAVTGVSPFSIPSEYPHSSNSAGTLHMSLNSAQLQTSTGELRGVGPDVHGSAGTSPASPSTATSAPNVYASAITTATAVAAMATPTIMSAGSAGHFSGILARVRGSMGKSRSRSKSLSRTFVSTVVPLDTASSTAANSGGSGQGSVRHDLAALPAAGSGDASGLSSRLPSLFQSNSSGGGGGGGVVAAASRTLRGLTEKLPTLPEAGHAPLMREIRHIRLRLVPLRLAARGPRVRVSNALAAAAGHGPMQSARAVAPGEGSVPAERQRHEGEPQSYIRLRAADYMQVYRVTLLAPEGAMQPLAPVQPSPQSTSAKAPNPDPAVALPAPSSPSFHLQTQPRLYPQPHPPQAFSPSRQSPSPAKQVALATAGPQHIPNTDTGIASTISNQSHTQRRSETGLEIVASDPASCTDNCQDLNVGVGVGPREALTSGDGDALQSGTSPLPSGGGIVGEVEEASETVLVNQFLSGFADLADQQLAQLWAAHPERSLLQDRRPGNIVQLRTRLVAHTACEEVFARDSFLF
ncbi:hypothetical protein Vafri_12100, partial [Volvox africanus]